jgi:hypothetical protein
MHVRSQALCVDPRNVERGCAAERTGDLPLVVLALDGVSRDVLYELRQATPVDKVSDVHIGHERMCTSVLTRRSPYV